MIQILTFAFAAGGVYVKITNMQTQLLGHKAEHKEVVAELRKEFSTKLAEAKCRSDEKLSVIAERQIDLEERNIRALDKLGDAVGALANEVRSSLGDHGARISVLEAT
jgi:hypothetical protein